MALCNIKIFKDSKIVQGKNYMIEDDLKLKEYLNSLQHLNFQIQYQRIELDKTIKINMPQQVQNQGYADDVLPLFNNFNYMEIKNDDYNKSYYYFITAMRQVARQTIELDLHMDVLNTFKVNIDYSFDERTRVTREFKDRFKNDTLNIESQETTIMRDIDIFSEGIQCELYKNSERTIEKTDSVNATDRKYLNQDFYLVFYSKSDSNEIIVYLFPQNYHTKVNFMNQDYELVPFEMRSTDISNYNKQNELLIIKIPYIPNGLVYDYTQHKFVASTDEPSLLMPVYENGKQVNTLTLQNDEKNKIMHPYYYYGDNGDLLPFEVNEGGIMLQNLKTYLPYLLDDTKEQFLLVEKSKGYESKLFHSDYYYHKLAFDSDSIMVELQKINNSNLDIDYNLINGRVSNTLNSSFIFKLDQYIDEDGARFSEDYTNVLISNKNNQVSIINSDYINYLRNGYNYDKKINEMDSASDIKNLVLNGLQFGAGLALAPATGGISAISAIQGGIGLVNGFINLAENQERRNIAMEQKLIQLKNQAVNVRCNSPIDISEFYSKNRLIDFEYSIRERTKDVLFNLFYYCGYTQSRYGAPKFNQRARFEFIQCEAVFKNVYRISQEIIDELIICYTNGVFYLHYVDSFENMFNFKYENWENSLLNKLFPPQS